MRHVTCMEQHVTLRAFKKRLGDFVHVILLVFKELEHV